RANDEDAPLARAELLEHIAGVEGVLTQLHDKVDAELMEAAGAQLRVIANYAVGFNNIDVDEATRRGIVVCNTPGVLSDATADIAWTLILGTARRAIEGDQMMRAGEFHGWGPNMLLGGDLVGKTLVIVGAGRIGFEVARRSLGWRMRILYVARSAHEDFETELGAERVSLDEALAQADYVSLHVPITDETHHLINADRLAMMKPTAYLINTARGPVVDEAALVTALQNHQIAGAGLDVYEAEPKMTPGLAECPNTLLLPHLGSATHETRDAMSALTARNLLAVLQGAQPPHAVNPDVAAARVADG
ncbi:MAG: D-glycerate dehydrogenase, partial [Phycisphaeraceae bacterium]